jgi:hypothetical protein
VPALLTKYIPVQLDIQDLASLLASLDSKM